MRDNFNQGNYGRGFSSRNFDNYNNDNRVFEAHATADSMVMTTEIVGLLETTTIITHATIAHLTIVVRAYSEVVQQRRVAVTTHLITDKAALGLRFRLFPTVLLEQIVAA